MTALNVADSLDVPAIVELVRQGSDLVQGRFAALSQLSVTKKSDGSPVSEVDTLCEALLTKGLQERTPWPVIGEEGEKIDVTAGAWWVVDPLDGTKEFLNGIPEFSVNVALISNGRPVAGFLAAPATGEIYYAVAGSGVNVSAMGEVAVKLPEEHFVFIASRFHADVALEERLAKELGCVVSRCGSALKFARIATGRADIYLRTGRTMEWDTAAGHLLVESSGGVVTRLDSGDPLRYGKSGFANPGFVACSGRARATVDRIREIVRERG